MRSLVAIFQHQVLFDLRFHLPDDIICKYNCGWPANHDAWSKKDWEKLCKRLRDQREHAFQAEGLPLPEAVLV